MERKNTILLTVIAVATLLVAVVGATFAYFTATTDNIGSGAGSTSSATTVTTGTVSMPLSSTVPYTYLSYPGGYGISGAYVSPTSTDTAYDIKYRLTMSFTNETTTTLTWTLYSSANPVTTDPSCQVATDTTSVPDETHYYYTDCAITDYTDLVEVGTGSIAAETSGYEVNSQEFTTRTSNTVYYYLVVYYPNDTENSQNADQGKTISAQITGTTGVEATPVE